jgi:DNA-binding Lrp family transcriptional regulator
VDQSDRILARHHHASGDPSWNLPIRKVTQRMLAEVAAALRDVPEVLDVVGLSRPTDVLVRVAARDADDLYRIAGQLLATDGVERSNTSLVMRTFVGHRMAPLLKRISTT